MKVRVRTNVEEVIADLDKKITRIRGVAVPRALNRLRDMAQTAGLKAIADYYGINRTTMLKYGRLVLEYATANDPESAIVVSGVTFPLWIFPHTRTSKGVLVTLHGRQFLFPHAFMIRSRGQKVFARGSYRGAGKPTGETFWRFAFGRPRFPFSILKTMSPRGVFAKADVVEAMQFRVAEGSSRVLANEIRFALRGVG